MSDEQSPRRRNDLNRSVDRTGKAAHPVSVWWISRHPALALLAATSVLSPVVFPPATVSGQVNNDAPTSSAQTIALNPQQIAITITGNFELPRGPTSFDRAVKEIGDQIERRREAELDKASTLGAFWRARFWDYLPKGSGSMNSPTEEDDDPFFTPSYLTLSYRVLDRQLAESEARSRVFFGR
jgi:hypothetical protein